MLPKSKTVYFGSARTYVYSTYMILKQPNSQVSLPGCLGRDCAAEYNVNMQCHLHIYYLQAPTIPPHEQHIVECR